MESNQVPRLESGDQSVWTVDGSQHRLAVASNETKLDQNIFSKTPRRRLEIFLILSVSLIVILIFGLLLATFLVIDVKMMNDDICYSHKCIRSASNFLISINDTKNPCDNFFEYVCGNWRHEHPSPEPFWFNSWFSEREKIVRRNMLDYLTKESDEGDPESVQNARIVYESCMNYEYMNSYGITALNDLINKIGLNNNPFEKPKQSWVKSLARIRLLLGKDLIIGSGVMPSTNNSTINQLVVGSPEETEKIPGSKFDLDKKNNLKKRLVEGDDNTVTAWEKYAGKMMKTVIKELDLDIKSENISVAIFNIIKMIRNFSDIETAKNISKSVLNEVPVQMSFKQLQQFMDESTPNGVSKFNLTEYFEVIYEDMNVKLDYENDQLLVYKKNYFGMLSNYLQSINDQDLELYIWWDVIYTLGSHINEELKDVKDLFVSKIIGDVAKTSRANVCLDTVYTLMDQALAYFIISTKETKKIEQVSEMLENIKSVFANHIDSLSWMDKDTKVATIEKLRNMNNYLGIPKSMENFKNIDSYYNVTITLDTHLENIVNLLQYSMTALFDSLRDTNDRSMGEFDPLDINAYYEPSSNAITVPYGIMQFPFHDLGLQALNYGAIGSVLGHEMTHGFDNIGRLYDKVGNVYPWWSNKSSELFTNKTKCFEDEYDNFQIPNYNITVDGKNTLGENLADDGGIRFALMAYKMYVEKYGMEAKLPGMQNYNHEQLFFMSFANAWCSEYSLEALVKTIEEDEHSPEFVRVIVVLQNLQEFSDTWKCPLGSGMNPEKKCKLWV